MSTPQLHGDGSPRGPTGLRLIVGLTSVPLALLAATQFPAPEGLEGAAWPVACLASMMAVLWMTEALPIPVTALLPLVCFPITQVADLKVAAEPYADPVIFLFMGGFMISLSMQRWGLHRRIALGILCRVGSRPRSILAGFMLASALLSMWVSNAATTLMMLPIALSVTQLLKEIDPDAAARFNPPLMLALAYSASIGGFGTPIGTPPNAFLVGHMKREYGIDVGFGEFIGFGVPLMIVALPLTYWVLSRLAFHIPSLDIPGAGQRIQQESNDLGRMNVGERMTAMVFVLATLTWMLRPFLAKTIPLLDSLGDTGIAMLAGISLFVIPVDWRRGQFAMDWAHARRLPWDVLLLFGGGLTLARQIEMSGLAAWIGTQAAPLASLPMWAMILVICLVVTFLTELTSNTAMAATLLPIATSLAVGMGQHPLLFALPVCLSASCAFMLPVATPPNAIVFASGHVTLIQMARAGLWLNFALAGVISIASLTLARWIFHLD